MSQASGVFPVPRALWGGADAATPIHEVARPRDEHSIGDAVRSAGAEGELVFARVRVLVCGLLLIMPTYNVLREPDYPPFFWGFCVTVVAMALAIGFYHLTTDRIPPAQLGLVSSVSDITLVSTALLLFMCTGSPLVALNSKETFDVYFLAIAATALRCDRRVVLAAGSLAVAQYSALVLFAHVRWPLHSAVFAGHPAGAYSDAAQVARVILLGAAAIVASAIVTRAGRLVELATSDGLTGLLNRAAFDKQMEKELARARRYGQPLAVAMLDADRFKQINDTCGHATGDQVLRRIGRLLQTAMREADVVARYGGDEFVILLPETSSRGAARKLESIRARIETLFTTPAARLPVAVTVSAGVSSYPDDGGTAEALLAAADARLLQSKRCGRNRIAGPGLGA